MFYSFKKWMKMKALMSIGRGGVLYFDGSNEFIIDTENFVPDKRSKYGCAKRIFWRDIYYKSNRDLFISEEDKNRIALDAQSFLAKKGVIATIE